MTISSQTRKAGPFNGNGVTTSFPFTFKVFAASDLRVVFTDTAGMETDLVLDSDYSVTLNGDQNASPGGSITYPLSGDELATGQKLTAVGDIESLQETDLQNAGGFFPQVIEDALDRATMLIQQQQEELARTIRAALSDEDTAGLELPASAARASRVLGFDADGNFVTYTILEGSSVGTTFQQDFTATAGQTDFVTSFDFTPNVNALYVFQNGSKLLGGVDYTEGAGNTITLTTGAALDDLIEVVSFGISGDGFAEVSALAAAAAASAGAAEGDATQTALDRVQTGLDRTASSGSASSASSSAGAAAASAAAAAASAASLTVDATPTDGSGNAVSSNGVFDALALKAPAASPTFTGTVTMPAGTTTVAPEKMTTGTLLTTQQAGAREFAGGVQYFTPVVGRRGVVPAMQMFALDSDLAGANGTSPQNALGVGVTLEANTVYLVEGVFSFVKTSGTNSHTFTFGFGGTATSSKITGEMTITNQIPDTSKVQVDDYSSVGAFTIALSSLSSLAIGLGVKVRALVAVSTGGTFIPQYTLSSAPGGAYSTKFMSNLRVTAVGAAGANVNVGTWA